MARREKYRTIDLCAGIGGIRRGFEMTGRYVNVLSAEVDKYACQTYEHLFGTNPFNDVTDDDFKSLVAKTEYDVLLAGFPCQSFSRVGLKEGFDNKEKGKIFFHIAEIIDLNRPKSIFLENVDMLLTHNKGNTIKTILNVLIDELDYHVVGVDKNSDGSFAYDRKNLVRNSKNFGVPQNRPRTYIVCFDKKRYGESLLELIPDTTPNQSSNIVFANLNEVLSHNVDDKYYMSSGYWETLKKHKKRQEEKGNGYGYRIVNLSGNEHPIANTILATGGSGKERNLLIDYKKGVAGKRIKGKMSPINNDYIRVMTPDEWGKLQGFIGYGFLDDNNEEHFSFPDGMSDAQKYKQLGNSVTIPVVREFALFIDKCLKKLEST